MAESRSICVGCDRPIEGVKTCVERGEVVMVLCQPCARDVVPRHQPPPFLRRIAKRLGL